MSRDRRVLKRLEDQVWAAGGLRAWGRGHGFSASFISDVLHGRQPPSKRLLGVLGFERVRSVSYREAKQAAAPAAPKQPDTRPSLPVPAPGYVWAGFAGGGGGS
jgi:hypothetical protein